MKRVSNRLIAVGAALLLTAPAVFAQAQQDSTAPRPAGISNDVVYDPPALNVPSISLIDAVRTALQNDPNIKLSEVNTNLQAGAARAERGAFDTTLLGDLQFEFTQEELGKSEEKQQKDKRQQERDTEEQLNEKLNDLNELIAEIEKFQQDPDNYEVQDVAPEAADVQAQIDLANALIANANSPEVQAELTRLRDEAVERVKQGLIEARDKTLIARNERLESLRKLGGVPTVKQHFNGSIDLRLVKPTRTGIRLGAFLTVSGDGQNYKGKLRKQDFGGLGVPDLYRADTGITFTVPLGRGAGVESADARERAANIDWEASRLAFEHASALTALQTAFAYWDLVGAQQSLTAFEQSNALQARLVDLTQSLISGDELPAAELARVQASQSNIIGTLAGARRSVAAARIALARTMGLRVETEANAPAASTDFPEIPSEQTIGAVNLTQLEDDAVARRLDLQVQRRLQESGRVLLRAAQIDLAPRIDLTADLKMTGIGESSSVRYGLNEALFHKWTGPGARIALNVEYPIGNNVQRGLLMQAQAGYDQRTISLTDLERTIRANIAQEYASLVEVAAQARESQNAINYYQQLVDAEFEKLRLGSSTLIDTLLTEQRRTEAALSFVSARQQYAQLLAQLRFETGSIVIPDVEGSRITPENLTQLPVAGQQ